MKYSVFLYVVAILIFCENYSIAQVSEQAAIDSVLNICGSDSSSYNIFIWPDIFTEDSCFLRNNDTIVNPYSFSWFFFIDEMPNYNWGHDCSYIFMDSTTGNYIQCSELFFISGYDTLFEEVHISYNDTNSFNISLGEPYNSPNVSSDINKYAILFTGDIMDVRWNDLSHMYSALKNFYGFTDENMYVFIPEGLAWPDDLDNDETYGDFDGDCTYDNIQSTIEDLANNHLDGNDIFLFYATTHGGRYGNLENQVTLVLQDGEEELRDTALADMIDEINCSQIIFVIDACFSGGFEDDLEAVHRTVQTCTNGTNIMLIDPALGYNFLTYGYATALKRAHPS